MVKKNFLWHAKRGHGICFEIINPTADFKSVETILLNNYAISAYDYRSAFAYELTKYYNKDDYFITKIINKLAKLKLDEFYSIDYLFNNLYFFKLNDKIWNHLFKIIKRWLERGHFMPLEYRSIQSFLLFILDRNEYIEKTSELLKIHFNKFPYSNLCIDYDIVKPNNYPNLKDEYIDYENEIKSLRFIAKIKDEKYYDKIYFIYYRNYDDNINNYLITYFFNCNDNNIKKKIVLLIVRAKSKNSIDFMIKCLLMFDKQTDIDILSALMEIKSKKVKLLSNNLINTKYQSWAIPLILNNYRTNDYKKICFLFSKLKITYSNSTFWYQCEEALIKYFKRRNPDLRLLKYVRYFFENTICANQRYYDLKILLKYNMIENINFNDLEYDSNYETRRLAKKYIK